MSAVFGAFVPGLVYLSGRLLGCWRVPAFLGALILGICSLFWYHAVIAELYTISAAFITGVIVLFLLWCQTNRIYYLFAAGVVCGLNFGVHSFVVLLIPALLVHIFIISQKCKVWLTAVSGFFFGLVLTISAFLLVDGIDPPSSYYNSVVRSYLGVWGLI